MKRRLAVFILAIALAACGRADRADTILTIGRTADATSLDPAVTMSVADLAVIGLAYEQLTAIAPGAQGEVVGELAQSWTPAEDGMSWTFQLRQDARFDDGTPVTAQAVKFSFDRIVAVGRGPAQSAFWLESVDVVDDHSVRFNLRAPFPPLPALLSMPTGSIINPTIATHAVGDDNATAWLSEHTAGSGAYRLVRWDRDQALVLEANPSAPQQPLYFTGVEFRVIPDGAARRIQLEKGDIDISEGLSADDATAFAEMPGVRVVETPSGAVLTYLSLNTTRPPFNDVRVRRALAQAIDYESLVGEVMRGGGDTLAGPIPRGVAGFDPDLAPPRRNLEGARQLLRNASYANGVDVTLVTARAGATAQALQSNLGDAGFRVTLEQLSPGAFDARRSAGEFQILQDSWSVDFPDPWIVMNFLYSSATAGAGGNAARYSNPAVDALLERGQVEANAEQRAALYRDAQRTVVADMPIVLLYSPRAAIALRDNIEGLQLSAFQPSFYNAAVLTVN